MKKLICGLAFMTSTFGASATVQCPSTLSQDQMKALAEKGNVTIDGESYTTQDQQIIKDSLPSGINVLTKAVGKSAESDYQHMNNDNTVKQCFYKFRTYLQKFAKEDFAKFSIFPSQTPGQNPQAGNTSANTQHSTGPSQPVMAHPSGPVIPQYSQNPQSPHAQQPMRMPQPSQQTAQGMPHPSRPVIPQYGQNPQSAHPQHSMEMPQTPRPTVQRAPTGRALPTPPQAGQNPSTSATQQSEMTGTFIFHKDKEGKVITSKFAREAIGKMGQPYRESMEKDILYIKGTNGKEYLWYDPKTNNQKENKEMMDAYKVNFVPNLEGKPVKFKPTGKKLTIEGKEYELVTAIPTPLGG